MDPLSITASAITLIQVATSVTKTLRGLKHAIKNIDARVDDLCGELDRLTTCLKTVQETLDNCQGLDLASVGEALWQQCDVAISDCNMTLTAMSIMVEKIKGTGKTRGLVWKTKAVVNWNEHSADLATFQDKVHKSHLALQTMLQTITVSISLRSHDSIDLVHLKLDVLKKSIDDAFGAAMRPAGGVSYNQSDLRLIQNLRKLLDAAKQFHSTASSTASTIRDGTNGHWMSHSDPAISLMGDFPPIRRQRVEDYVRAGRYQRYQSPDSSGQRSPRRAMSPRRPRSPSRSPRVTSFSAIDEITAITPTEVVQEEKAEEVERQDNTEDDGDHDDDNNSEAEAEAEAERAFQDRLQELALDRFKICDYGNAVGFIQRALKLEASTDSAKAERRNLRTQLAVCHFLRGDWKQAEGIVLDLSKTKGDRDTVICTLLHALSLAHLFHYSFDLALSIGQQALLGRKRLLKLGSIEPSEVDKTRALLAIIYDVRGGDDDYIHADVLNGQLAEHFEYKHPKDEMEFITGHPTLLSTVFGDDIPDTGSILHAELPGEAFGPEMATTSHVGFHPGSMLRINCQATSPVRTRQAVTGGVSPLREKLTEHWRYEQDTAKCATSSPMPAPRPLCPDSMDADDEASTDVGTPTFPIKDRLTRLLTYRRPRPVRLEDAPDSAETPTTTDPPKSRWLRGNSMAGPPKAKKLVRKRSQEEVPKRQKLSMSLRFHSRRSMKQAETMDSAEVGVSIMDWLRSQPTHENKKDRASVVARAGSSRGSLCGPPDDYFGPDALAGCHTLPFASYAKATGLVKDMARLLPSDPYTLNDGVAAVEDNRNACVTRMGNGIYHELMDTSICPELMDTGPVAEVSSSPVPTGDSTEEHRNLGRSAREVLCYPSGDAELREKNREPDTATTSPASFRSHKRLPELRTTGLEYNPAIESLHGLIAGLFAALPSMSDENERYATSLSLGRLLPYVHSVCNDFLLEHDIKRVINILEKKGSFGENDASDSGYETMFNDTTGPTRFASEVDVEAESELEDDVAPSIPCSKNIFQDRHRRKVEGKPTTPVLRQSLPLQAQTYSGLKRAFSFVVGAEDVLS
ncbi:hypothetical protein VMCG_02680 [Cytospora schulzeri]|uniref:Fungal N-terminal domain-containing protein n=1 Tax=Cytospora schulzeri TaxID=448051 RepID=A0A423WZS0_9PEZI|nr:hypothetical protein VMCG_02680 [Valsa malicola]